MKRIDTPTTAEPGSLDKILLMRARYEQGVDLHIPGDAEVVYAPAKGGRRRSTRDGRRGIRDMALNFDEDR